MNIPSRFEFWYGRNEPPTGTRTLRAGPVEAQLDGGDLRYVRIGDVELVRRVYVAVRDLDWNTIAADLANVEVEERHGGFVVRFDARHHRHDIDFAWRGTIIGSPDGTIEYTMDGAAQSAFPYAKIGLCIHHPIKEDAARPFSGRTPDGPVGGVLPLTIGPQVHLDDGTDLPLFAPVTDLAIDIGGDRAVRFAFEGDLFEMEDQRNWTDASFKTASTPASLGYHHQAWAGQSIRQSVTMRVIGPPASLAAPITCADELYVDMGGPIGRGVPLIGLGMASHGEDLLPREVDLLRRLRLDHVRVDVHLQGDQGDQGECALLRAVAACRALDCGLELALFLSDAPGSALDRLAELLDATRVPVRRVLVFQEGKEVAAGHGVRLARERLRAAAPRAAFTGGTNIYFNELNRNRPDVAAMDAVAYSINPQIHAFDEASLTEAIEGQAETIVSARAFCGDLPLIVSPVTLKPRFNAVATVADGEQAPGELPDTVDPRQMSLFGAAWTLGSVKRLAESGAASLTYYETTGWRGVMETAAGSPPTAPFPSRPGMIFPLYHVLADLGEWRSGELLDCRSSDPLTISALAVRDGSARHILLANMTPHEQQVMVRPLAVERVTLRRLNEGSVAAATADPMTFRSTTEIRDVSGRTLALTLASFEMARVDVQNTPA